MNPVSEDSEMGKMLEKYAATFEGCELQLYDRVLSVLMKAIVPVPDQHASHKGYADIRVTITAPNHPREVPHRWVVFEACSLARVHRFGVLMPLPDKVEGEWFTTADRVRVAYTAAMTHAAPNSLPALLLERRRDAPWPKKWPEAFDTTVPCLEMTGTIGAVKTFDMDVIGQALDACRCFSSEVAVQWSSFEKDAIRLDVVRTEQWLTCIIAPLRVENYSSELTLKRRRRVDEFDVPKK